MYLKKYYCSAWQLTLGISFAQLLCLYYLMQFSTLLNRKTASVYVCHLVWRTAAPSHSNVSQHHCHSSRLRLLLSTRVYKGWFQSEVTEELSICAVLLLKHFSVSHSLSALIWFKEQHSAGKLHWICSFSCAGACWVGKAGSEADRDINLNNTVPRTLCLYQIPDTRCTCFRVISFSVTSNWSVLVHPYRILFPATIRTSISLQSQYKQWQCTFTWTNL